MGAIQEGREALAAIETQHADIAARERSEAVSKIVGNLSGPLAELEFTGDVETALLHYMGESAVYDEAITKPYTDLAERIEAGQAKDRDRKVPVLFVYDELDEEGRRAGMDSMFVSVSNLGPVQFRSMRTREDDVIMHAFTGRSVEDEETGEADWHNDTASVTHNTLSLVGMSLHFRGDIVESDAPLHVETEIKDGVVLSERHVADDGRGQGMPSDYAYRDYDVNRLAADHVPQVLVGWGEIEEAMIAGLNRRGLNPDKALSQAQKVKHFFQHTVGEIEFMRELVPRAAKIVEASDGLEQAMTGSA